MKKFLAAGLTATGLALGTMMSVVAPAAAQENRVEVGVLECEVEGGVGLLIGSRKEMRCEFDPADGVVGSTEVYFGEIRKLGLDIGVTKKTIIAWLVFAPTKSDYAAGSLAGDYVGVSGEASFGVGLGANALIGGSRESFALQPFSVQAQTGLNLAVGVSRLILRSADR